MIIISVFLGLLLAYCLISRRLERTVLTAPILFTVGGMGLLMLMPGLGDAQVERESFLLLAEMGLVMLLFTDATHVNPGAFREPGRMPVRLLSTGMLLTILLGALAARAIFPQLSWWEAGILAAVLAPTDAGLGQVIVRSPRVPLRIRQALDVEAGMNDGMAVPFLLFFLALARTGTDGAGAILLRHVAEQLGIGAILGGVIGLAGGWLLGQARRRQWMADSLQQLGLVSLPLLSVMACEIFGGSMFIAAYVAGLAVQSGFAEAGHHSAEFTEGWGQLFSYFIFFYFGLRVTLTLGSLTLWHLLYAVLSLTVIRMLPVAIALAGTRLSTASVLFMGWFGPRGLASIVLGLVFLAEEAQLPGEQTIALTVIATVLLSIFAHGLSALPGIGRYARKVDTLAKTAPEFGKIETIPREPRPSAQDRKAW